MTWVVDLETDTARRTEERQDEPPSIEVIGREMAVALLATLLFRLQVESNATRNNERKAIECARKAIEYVEREAHNKRMQEAEQWAPLLEKLP